ncbi:hypothetical protein A9E74_02353 [Methylophaga muralis]|uniref:Uncharacterized protein n=1 Tax=Methylophaga muralis TaxID=291169 RepID=A0A1E3GPF8_9GAMM|nr:hypothetical protein A9E74_02353 [Methylophaga muralis]
MIQNHKYKFEMADKPGSVVDNHSSGTDVTICLKQPTREPCGPHVMPKHLFLYLVLLLVGFTMPLLLPEARCALTAPFHPYLKIHSGGLLSVALAVDLRPPGVTWHLTLWSPDFPHSESLRTSSAIVWPSQWAILPEQLYFC